VEGLFFEDFTEGRVFVTAGITMTEASIIEFAAMHDPQPFHLDKEAAQKSIFGGLVASGFQTMALSFRLFASLGTLKNNLGGPGVDAIRWPRPVFAGDTIHCRVTVTEPRASKSRPDRGILRWRFETLNQRDEVVMTGDFISFMKRRGA
jgi:acyl dehydratase